VQVGAEHGDDDVEVYLQFVGDAFFDAEEVGFVAGVPATEFGEGKEGADYDEGEGGVAACGAATGVGGFGFGWEVLAGAHFEGWKWLGWHVRKEIRRSKIKYVNGIKAQ